jgi:CRP-like cAMP-binding protein
MVARQGDQPNFCYIVLGGTLKVVRRMTQKHSGFEDGQHKLYDIAELWKGDCFSMQSILTHQPIGYSVVSVVSSELLRTERQNILRYDSYLSYPEDEINYSQDHVFKQKLLKEREWDQYKKIQMQ